MAARPSPAIIAEEMFLISIPSDDLTEEQIHRIRVLARGILEEMHAGGLAAWPGPPSVVARYLAMWPVIRILYDREHPQLVRLHTRRFVVATLFTRVAVESLATEDKLCGICHENFGEEEEEEEESESKHDPVRLPCGHIFGEECIVYWLVSENTCPYCRRDYGAPGEVLENGI